MVIPRIMLRQHLKIGSLILAVMLAVSSLVGCDSNNVDKLVSQVKEAVNTIGKPNPEVPENIATGFAYEQLTDKSKELYKQIVFAFTNSNKEIETAVTGADVILNVVDHVLMDHPEIFWYTSALCHTMERNGKAFKSKLEFEYCYNREEIAEKQTQIESVTGEILSRVPTDASDYDKAKFVYDEIISTTEYNLESADNQNICSVFVNHESVCAGYAKATQYLLQKLGIEATYVWGDVTSVDGTEPHAWNLLVLDGEYYYMDTTWGDPQYATQNDKDLWENEIIYDYFCVTSAEISQTHSSAVAMKLPDCTATTCNYYVRNGLYFTTFDLNQIAEILKNGYANGDYNISVRFSTAEAFDSAVAAVSDVYETSAIEVKEFYYRICAETRVLSMAVKV